MSKNDKINTFFDENFDDFTNLQLECIEHTIDAIDQDDGVYHEMNNVPVENDLVNATDFNHPLDQSIDNGRNLIEDQLNGNENEEKEISFTEIDEFPKTIDSCYALNTVYRDSLEVLRDQLEDKLQANLDMQEELMNSESIINEHVYPNSLLKFLAPYFRDNKGYGPDDNDETRSRKATGCINTFYLRLRKPWKEPDKLSLRFAVENYVTKKNMEPHTRILNRLLEEIDRLKLQGASQEIINEKSDLVDAQKHEIESIKSASTLPLREHSDDIDWLEVAQMCPPIYNEFDCEAMWTNCDHPSINHDKWSDEELDKLKSLVKTAHPDWDKVAKDLGTGRVAWQCCHKYQSSLNDSLLGSGPFTYEESILLKKLVAKVSIGDFIPWPQVAYFMEGRSLAQIKHFWAKNQCMRRGANWNDLEDKVLIAAVRKLGTRNWKHVAYYIPGRTNRQCRERYMLRLGIKDRKIADWSPDEDLELVNTAPNLKFRWVDMMARLTNRNPRQIAARYDTLERSKIAKAIETLKDLRDLVPRNKSFGKRSICPELELQLEEGKTIDDFLREGRKKLENLLKNGTHRTKIIRPGVGGRKKKPETEEKIEQELVRRFSEYSLMGKQNNTKRIARSGQEAMLFDVLETILTDYFACKLPEEPHLLANVISSSLRNHAIGVNPTHLDYCPPIFPPNIVTTQSYQVFLYMKQRLSQQLTGHNIETDQYTWHPHYRTLLGAIVSLYFWPCLLSKQPPNSTKRPSNLPLPSSFSSPSSPSTSTSSSLTTPSAQESSKRRKKSIDHCNDAREKQRRLFKSGEDYFSRSNVNDN